MSTTMAGHARIPCCSKPYPAMSEPSHDKIKVFGAVEEPFQVASTGSSSWITLDLPGYRALMAALDQAPPAKLRGLAYLRLQSVTGDFPTALKVYLGLPEGADPEEHPEHLAGGLGLYGLRQASRQTDQGEGGRGMSFSLDVTKVFSDLRLAVNPSARTPAAIRVSIVPYRRMPVQAQLTIGKVTLCHVIAE